MEAEVFIAGGVILVDGVVERAGNINADSVCLDAVLWIADLGGFLVGAEAGESFEVRFAVALVLVELVEVGEVRIHIMWCLLAPRHQTRQLPHLRTT